ncbi:hypothetical protein PR048_031445, partial [Dryococelus australis]
MSVGAEICAVVNPRQRQPPRGVNQGVIHVDPPVPPADSLAAPSSGDRGNGRQSSRLTSQPLFPFAERIDDLRIWSHCGTIWLKCGDLGKSGAAWDISVEDGRRQVRYLWCEWTRGRDNPKSSRPTVHENARRSLKDFALNSEISRKVANLKGKYFHLHGRNPRVYLPKCTVVIRSFLASGDPLLFGIDGRPPKFFNCSCKTWLSGRREFDSTFQVSLLQKGRGEAPSGCFSSAIVLTMAPNVVAKRARNGAVLSLEGRKVKGQNSVRDMLYNVSLASPCCGACMNAPTHLQGERVTSESDYIQPTTGQHGPAVRVSSAVAVIAVSRGTDISLKVQITLWSFSSFDWLKRVVARVDCLHTNREGSACLQLSCAFLAAKRASSEGRLFLARHWPHRPYAQGAQLTTDGKTRVCGVSYIACAGMPSQYSTSSSSLAQHIVKSYMALTQSKPTVPYEVEKMLAVWDGLPSLQRGGVFVKLHVSRPLGGPAGLQVWAARGPSRPRNYDCLPLPRPPPPPPGFVRKIGDNSLAGAGFALRVILPQGTYRGLANEMSRRPLRRTSRAILEGSPTGSCGVRGGERWDRKEGSCRLAAITHFKRAKYQHGTGMRLWFPHTTYDCGLSAPGLVPSFDSFVSSTTVEVTWSTLMECCWAEKQFSVGNGLRGGGSGYCAVIASTLHPHCLRGCNRSRPNATPRAERRRIWRRAAELLTPEVLNRIAIEELCLGRKGVGRIIKHPSVNENQFPDTRRGQSLPDHNTTSTMIHSSLKILDVKSSIGPPPNLKHEHRYETVVEWSGEVRVALNSEVLRADEGDNGTAPERNGETPEKIHRPAASIRERPSTGIEPGSPWWEASSLTTIPPRPLLRSNVQHSCWSYSRAATSPEAEILVPVVMEQRLNARWGRSPKKKKNPSPTSGIVRHDSHLRKSGSDPRRKSDRGPSS